ncbi:hypothetical protein [Sandaracinus amylolyticus]|uniref:Transglutaminase-like domain-containing protein n=1 Tax=Sandaracinus amylolyticus TaxID=927083 RepID=A0A0F6YLP3_9BACT|nr:hypothetical protein [Sandaracinus amylolyticus]AKF09701.1 hypothetical protein DB32_006850 [Sandaracinus amylolyticus]
MLGGGSISRSLVALAALAGCAGEPSTTTLTHAPPVATAPVPTLRASLRPADDQLVAADPLLDGFDGWPITFEVSASRDRCEIALARDGTTLRRLDGCDARWDGRDESGDIVAPGALVATARLVRADGSERARAESALEVVRLGIDCVQLEGPSRVPLLYRATAGLRDGWYEVGSAMVPWQLARDASEGADAVALELADGTPRALPAPWDDVLSPPLDERSDDGVEHDTYSLPTAWIAGAEITARVRLASIVAGGIEGAPRDVEVRVVAPEGLAIEGEDRFAEGAEIFARTTSSPVPAVGRYDVAWRFTFEARRGDGAWQRIPGATTPALRLYGLVAEPVFDLDRVPYRAWVDVVDRIATWVDGASADEREVAAAIVEGIYTTMGLRYDTARGASFYTDYATDFSGATFSMQRFEERASGSVVNCSDAASILTAYANMVGIDLRYHILTNVAGAQVGFDLNYIRAIGGTEFDETPFDSGRGGFRYHAIVGSRDGRTWDATLAVDGDGTPAAPPHLPLLVQGLEPDVYLAALSSEPARIRADYDERVRIR